MSMTVSGVIGNTTAPILKSAGNGTPVNFSSILQKSSQKYGIDLDAMFDAAADKYNVPTSLLKAVAKAESNFNPNATSPAGAMGIMQLMPGTAESLGVTDAYDPGQNIMGGAKYLRGLLDRFDGDTTLAVAAYNAGPNAIDKYDGVPPYSETQNYVKTVLGYLGQDITAGTVSASGGNPIVTATAGTTGNQNLGTLLEGSLLSGGFSNDDLSGLLSSINSSDPKDVTNKLMASVYQLQLQMLQGGSEDGGNSVIV